MSMRDVGRISKLNKPDIRPPLSQVVTPLVVQGDIQTFGFLFVRYPESNHYIHDLKQNKAYDGSIDKSKGCTLELGQQLITQRHTISQTNAAHHLICTQPRQDRTQITTYGMDAESIQ